LKFKLIASNRLIGKLLLSRLLNHLRNLVIQFGEKLAASFGSHVAASGAEQTLIQTAISASLWSPSGNPPAEDCCATTDTAEASHIISPKMAIGRTRLRLTGMFHLLKAGFTHGTPLDKPRRGFPREKAAPVMRA
jgi:hypothetical protein